MQAGQPTLALALGDHFSFRVDEYANMHPDLYEKHDSDLNIIMELQNIELVKQMTVRRSALGLVSRLVMSQQKNQDHLVMLQINDEPMCRVFSLVTTHKSLERPNVRRLCDIASEIYDTEMLFPRAAEAAV